jgi:DNA-binding beta-propeller fold protein YncE
MKTILAAAVAASLTFSIANAGPQGPGAPQFAISLQHLSSIGTDSIGSTGAEIVAYDAKTKRAFAINSTDNDLAVIDLANPAAPILIYKVSLDSYGAGLNGVDTHDGLVAVAVEASPKTDPGKVVFLDARTLAVRGAVTVGSLPDMLTFDGDGQRLLVANEGEPVSYLPGAVNPEGSVSIVDPSRGVARATVRTADFRAFSKDALLAMGVRVFGPGATAAQDLEPEYITISGRTAWVTLQEANAVAVVDVPTAVVTGIVPLGLKDHSLPGHGLDASDRDGSTISIATWPVFGLYQPDAIASFRVGKQHFLVTANEGDSRSSASTSPTRRAIRTATATSTRSTCSERAPSRSGRRTANSCGTVATSSNSSLPTPRTAMQRSSTPATTTTTTTSMTAATTRAPSPRGSRSAGSAGAASRLSASSASAA